MHPAHTGYTQVRSRFQSDAHLAFYLDVPMAAIRAWKRGVSRFALEEEKLSVLRLEAACYKGEDFERHLWSLGENGKPRITTVLARARENYSAIGR
jgi:hypothetical protein